MRGMFGIEQAISAPCRSPCRPRFSAAFPQATISVSRRTHVRIRSITAQVVFLTVAAASQLRAQRVIDLTADMLDRFLRGADAENVEMGKSGDQLKELDDKIKKFRDCKRNWEIATGNADGKLGMAARLAMRAKCGASDED